MWRPLTELRPRSPFTRSVDIQPRVSVGGSALSLPALWKRKFSIGTDNHLSIVTQLRFWLSRKKFSVMLLVNVRLDYSWEEERKKKPSVAVVRISYPSAKCSRKGKKTVQTGKKIKQHAFFSKLAVPSSLLPNIKLCIFSPPPSQAFSVNQSDSHHEIRSLRARKVWRHRLWQWGKGSCPRFSSMIHQISEKESKKCHLNRDAIFPSHEAVSTEGSGNRQE